MEAQRAWSLVLSGPASGPRAVTALLLRLATSGVVLLFGAAKFLNHTSEVRSFRSYGLPTPDALVNAVGLLEVVGGGMLLLGALVRVAAVALAGDMVGAIILSGINQGETISLTLAPAMLLCLLALLWTGAGILAVDRRFSTG